MTVHIIADIDGKLEKFTKKTTTHTFDFYDAGILRELSEPEPPLVQVYDYNDRLVVINKKAIIFAGGDT